MYLWKGLMDYYHHTKLQVPCSYSFTVSKQTKKPMLKFSNFMDRWWRVITHSLLLCTWVYDCMKNNEEKRKEIKRHNKSYFIEFLFLFFVFNSVCYHCVSVSHFKFTLKLVKERENVSFKTGSLWKKKVQL